MIPKDFIELIKPYSLDDFFCTYWGKNFLTISGAQEKFSDLLSWEKFNLVLSEHRLNSPRLRLMLNGQNIPESSYITYNRARRGDLIPRLVPVEFNRHLREGATLVLDAIDEMVFEIRKMAEIFEKTFHEYIQVNAYASWGTTRGFDLHWDDHDVIVLQIDGKKRWSIYGEARKFPLYLDIEPNKIPPESPVWEGLLTAGDFLYIPRGWWHMATALAEPSLHLTFGINNRTVIDLLQWLIDQLRAKELFRSDLPRFAKEIEQIEKLNIIKEIFLEEWDSNLMTRFFEDYDSKAVPRVTTGLPWSALPEVFPDSDNINLKLITSRRIMLNVKEEEGIFLFRANGKMWQFAIETLEIIKVMMPGKVCSIKEIYSSVEGRLDRSTVRNFLSELIIEGIVVIVDG